MAHHPNWIPWRARISFPIYSVHTVPGLDVHHYINWIAVYSDWEGDPCASQDYWWDGINCSNDEHQTDRKEGGLNKQTIIAIASSKSNLGWVWPNRIYLFVYCRVLFLKKKRTFINHDYNVQLMVGKPIINIRRRKNKKCRVRCKCYSSSSQLIYTRI